MSIPRLWPHSVPLGPAIVTVLCLLAVLASVTPAAASCSVMPNGTFFTRGQGEWDAITSSFFGTITDASGPAGSPVYTVDVGVHVAGEGLPHKTVRFSGSEECSWVKLNVGQRYLFAFDPRSPSISGSLVFETDGPAWRWMVGLTVWSPLLDGDRVPSDPDRLLAFLRRHLTALPATATVMNTPPAAPTGALLAVVSGLVAGVLALRRLRGDPAVANPDARVLHPDMHPEEPRQRGGR